MGDVFRSDQTRAGLLAFEILDTNPQVWLILLSNSCVGLEFNHQGFFYAGNLALLANYLLMVDLIDDIAQH